MKKTVTLEYIRYVCLCRSDFNGRLLRGRVGEE